MANCAASLLIVNPAGPVNIVVTVTGTSISTNVLSSIVPTRVTSDATGRIGLAGILVMVTDTGGWTVTIEVEIANQ